MPELPDYVLANRNLWDSVAAAWIDSGERNWAEEPSWGIWGIPEDELSLLPDDMSGMDAIELGCGTAYVSAWMSRRGARCVGIDNSERQLQTAGRLARKHAIEIDLIHGNAEEVPLPDRSFDFAISEYGAAIWADPYKWIPEAWRLLRPEGLLVFLGHHPFATLCTPREDDRPAGRELRYPYFGLHRIEWQDETGEGTEFNMTISRWMRLFDAVGFDIVSFHEIRSPSREGDSRFFVGPDWAYDYLSEQAWKLCKR